MKPTEVLPGFPFSFCAHKSLSVLFVTICCCLDHYQEQCSLNCMEKYMKMNQRISQRFQEYQMIANESAIAAAQKVGSMTR